MSAFDIDGVPLAEAAGKELTEEHTAAFLLSLKYATAEGSTFKEDVMEIAEGKLTKLKLGGMLGSEPNYAHMIMFFNDIVSPLNHTPLHIAFLMKKFDVAKFYIEAGHKLNVYADSGETPFDSLISECTDITLFDLYLEKGGCSLMDSPGYVCGATPQGTFFGGPPPNIPPLFSAAQCCNLIYTKHIVGLMKLAGLPINTPVDIPGLGEKTALEFSTFFLENTIPQMIEEDECPPDMEANCKGIVEFLTLANATPSSSSS